MQEDREQNSEVLRCPLCGGEEYLLSDNNTMLCASCGVLVQITHQLHAVNSSVEHSSLLCGPRLNSAHIH